MDTTHGHSTKRRTTALAPTASSTQEQLICSHLPLAYRLAARYRDKGVPLEDIRQVAALGLVKAAAGYVDGPGRTFHNYAIPTINGELRRHFRDRGWWIRPPRALQEAQAAVRSAEEELTSELQRKPSDAELARATDLDPREVHETRTLAACYSPRSLDTAPEGFSGTPVDSLSLDDKSIDDAEWRLCLTDAMEKLSERDQRIVSLRFVEEWTQAEIGAELGVTQMQVSRLLTRILATLHNSLSDAMGVPDAHSPAHAA